MIHLIGSKELETERLLLRPTIESDLKVLWETLCIPEVNKYYLTAKLHTNWEEEKPWQYKKLETALDPDKFQWSIVLKENGECIGQISVGEAHDEDESITDNSIRGVGWFIHPNYQRQGYATESAKKILAYMFDEVGITEIKTGAAIKNIASWKLMDRLGFKRKNYIYQTKYTFLDEPEDLYPYGFTKEDYLEEKRKVVLVTGSQRGIGASTIQEFASHGYDVIIDYYEEEEKAITLKEYVEDTYHVKALAIRADVRKEEEVNQLVEQALAYFGHIDVLVNNAGIAIDKEFVDRTIDDWKDTLATNLVGPYIVAKRVGKEMLKRKSGKIINVTSTNGINAFFPTSMDYDASKAGLINLTHNLAIEFAPFINVNAVAPGWVNTAMNKDLPENLVREETSKIYLGRFAEPKEIASVIYFLSTEEAKYINSEIIKVDGGY